MICSKCNSKEYELSMINEIDLYDEYINMGISLCIQPYIRFIIRCSNCKHEKQIKRKNYDRRI